MQLQSRAKISDARRQIALLDAVAVAAGRNIARAMTANRRMRGAPAFLPPRSSMAGKTSISGRKTRSNIGAGQTLLTRSRNTMPPRDPDEDDDEDDEEEEDHEDEPPVVREPDED